MIPEKKTEAKLFGHLTSITATTTPLQSKNQALQLLNCVHCCSSNIAETTGCKTNSGFFIQFHIMEIPFLNQALPYRFRIIQIAPNLVERLGDQRMGNPPLQRRKLLFNPCKQLCIDLKPPMVGRIISLNINPAMANSLISQPPWNR